GFGVPAVALSPAAICLTLLPVLNCAMPDRVVTEVRPREALTVKVVGWVPSTTTAPSLVVKLTVVPANVDIWALPVSSIAMMLFSAKLRRRLLLGASSTRPTLLILTVALL